MSDTSDRILDTAETLIQQGGYHGFSYQDIAERIGIKKASIYYHHPAKAALGREVIARYRRRFAEVRAGIEADRSLGPWDALGLYLEPIVAMARTADIICLCGVLGGEYAALPEEMKREIAGFFTENQAWLADLLAHGRESGAFAFEGAPEDLAKLSFSAIEGALLIQRATGEDRQFDDVMRTLKSLLGG